MSYGLKSILPCKQSLSYTRLFLLCSDSWEHSICQARASRSAHNRVGKPGAPKVQDLFALGDLKLPKLPTPTGWNPRPRLPWATIQGPGVQSFLPAPTGRNPGPRSGVQSSCPSPPGPAGGNRMETLNFVNFTEVDAAFSAPKPDRRGRPRGSEWHVQASSALPASRRQRLEGVNVSTSSPLGTVAGNCPHLRRRRCDPNVTFRRGGTPHPSSASAPPGLIFRAGSAMWPAVRGEGSVLSPRSTF